MGKSCPVMEQLLEENENIRFYQNRSKGAQQRKPVDQRSSLKFPDEILMMLGTIQMTATIQRVTCVHVFETMPQSKCAVAYEIRSPRHDDDNVFVIIVYSTTANQVLRILWAESEVTQMCTPADDQILIAGNSVGSLCLYDLADFESSTKRDFLDYRMMIAIQNPDLLAEDDQLQIT